MARIGEQIGHYRLVSKIGAGGMGDVYLAQDTKLDRKVAIKFLKDEFSSDTGKLSRFVREAKAVSSLNHPNILTVYEIGEIESKNYLVTEFIEGKTLRAYLSTAAPLEIELILRIGIQVSEALAAAHRAGIIHRDIKPENIMIREDGYAKVLDFGLAKLIEQRVWAASEEDKTLIPTIPGIVLGTARYMSPEQARGKETDTRTDVWSLGVVLFEMLAGKVPFDGETFSHTTVAILEKEPPPLEDIPQEFQRIIRRALTKEKEMRYQTARDLLIDLKNLKRTLDLKDELERSLGGGSRENDKTMIFDFQESAAQIYQSSQNEKADSEARPPAQPIRAGSGGMPRYLKSVLIVILVLMAAAGGWWFVSGKRTGKENPAVSLLKSVGITSWSSGSNEFIVEASFSPDAGMIAFSSSRSGTTEIWVKPTVGGDMIQVTKNGFYNQYPVWSPTGQELAFFSSRGNQTGIWRSSFTGGEQKIITGDIKSTAYLRSWSASGKIYFQNESDLFAVEEKTGEIKPVTDFKERGLQPRVIEISPDESKIAFIIKENDLFKIKVRVFGSEQTSEIAASKDQIDYLSWHPNGRDLIFSATLEGTYHIFRGTTEGGAPVQLSTGDADHFVEDVSRDGERILYWSQNESSDLWMVSDQDGRESLLADSMASEYWGAVSPDGKSVTYQTATKASRPFSGSIDVKPITVSGSVPLTVSRSGFSPVWSASGSWIAFFRRMDKDVEIWRVEASGSNARKLASGGVQSVPYTSVPYLKIGINQLTTLPGSDSIVFTAKRDDISNIWLVSADGDREEQLTFNKDRAEYLCCPAWTPDGKRLVVSSNYISPDPSTQPNRHRLWLYADGASEQKMIFDSKERLRFLGIGNSGKEAVVAVFSGSAASTQIEAETYINLVSLETGAIRRVHTLNNAYPQNIHLSPDRKAIAYATRTENVSEIWIASLGGGAPRRLIAENNPKVFISSLSWSPDGKSIVFGKQSQNSLLSMLVK